jgi:hypothetical protein
MPSGPTWEDVQLAARQKKVVSIFRAIFFRLSRLQTSHVEDYLEKQIMSTGGYLQTGFWFLFQVGSKCLFAIRSLQPLSSIPASFCLMHSSQHFA